MTLACIVCMEETRGHCRLCRAPLHGHCWNTHKWDCAFTVKDRLHKGDGRRAYVRKTTAYVPWTDHVYLRVLDRLLWEETDRSVWPLVVDRLLALDLPVTLYDLAIDRLHDRLYPPPMTTRWPQT